MAGLAPARAGYNRAVAAGAFERIRILDFTQGLAGPLGCALLADLGADVVKVEPPEGDRSAAQPGYLCWNRNKRRAVLDLEDPAGLARARALIGRADIAVFDAARQDLERLGLDAASLRAADPALLHVHLPHWGADGWWSGLPVGDTLLWGLCGGAFAQFSWEDVPVQLVTPQLGYGHAMLGAGAIASALYERVRSGEGQAVTISGLHAMAGVKSGATLRTQDPPARSRAIGARGTAPNYKLYQCRDGEWLFLGTLIMHHFSLAIDALGIQDVLEMEGVDGQIANVLRRGVGGHVRERLEQRFRERDRDEWLRILHAAGVPSAPVGERQAWFDSPTVAANEMKVRVEHPELGPVEIAGVPAKLRGTPGAVRALMRDAEPDEVLESWPARESPQPRGTQSGGPLAGVRVLDLGVIIAGPFASSILANFGADVVKVEPLEGDTFRRYGLGFVGYNLGKRSVALDLKRPEGREVFYDLVRNADVVCDNYRLGVLERLGIDYAALREINPRIISVSVTAYGPEGPKSADPGFDPLLQAESGLMQAQGGDDEPVFHQIAVNDCSSAMVAAFGIAAALFARERSGEGQRVETCLANQSVLVQSGELVRYAGREPSRSGGRDCLGLGALLRYYACSDGWIGLAATEPRHFQALCEAAERNDLARAWPFERARAEPWDGPLAIELAATTAELESAKLLARLRERAVPAARVTPAGGTFECELHRANDFFSEVEHPTLGTLITARSFADFSRTPSGFPCASPLLGADNESLLAECGYDRGRIAELTREGVITSE